MPSLGLNQALGLHQLVVSVHLSRHGFPVDPAGVPTLMRPEIVVHQLGRRPHRHSGFAERRPPAETMPQRIRRQVPVGFVGHQLPPSLASTEHLVEAAAHIPKRAGVVRMVRIHHTVDLIVEGLGEAAHLATGFKQGQHSCAFTASASDFQRGHHSGGRDPVHGSGVPFGAGDLGHPIPHNDGAQLRGPTAHIPADGHRKPQRRVLIQIQQIVQKLSELLGFECRGLALHCADRALADQLLDDRCRRRAVAVWHGAPLNPIKKEARRILQVAAAAFRASLHLSVGPGFLTVWADEEHFFESLHHSRAGPWLRLAVQDSNGAINPKCFMVLGRSPAFEAKNF